MSEERDPVVEEVRETFTLKTFQERVHRLEAENKELKVTNSILQTQYNSHCETQSDILRTLHANLDENYSKIEESDCKIQKLEELLENQKQEFKDKLAEEREQSDQRAHELQSRNDILQAALDEVDEFKRNKDRLEEELANLKRQIQDMNEAHMRDVSAFDRKKAIEIDQLKKDMQKNIKETREHLKARTKDQLDSTTKRTIMENEQMATELHFQSKETERLLDRNQQLMDENSQLRRNLQIHKDLENELARRTHVYQKLIKKMQRSKPEAAAATLGGSGGASGQMQALDGSLQLIDTSIEGRLIEQAERSLSVSLAPQEQQANAALSQENESVKRQLEAQQSTLAMVRQEFAQYRRDHATLTQLQDQSTRLIIAALYELKNQRECDPFPPASYDEHANWQFTGMTTRQKEYFFRVLLEKLNSSMCGSCFPTGTGAPSPSQSTSSLPAINKQQKEGNSFSHFLWSVATHGAQPGGQTGVRQESRAVQTETEASDPCFQEGLWNPSLRSDDMSNATPSAVVGNVRNWGAGARSNKSRNTAPKARIV